MQDDGRIQSKFTGPSELTEEEYKNRTQGYAQTQAAGSAPNPYKKGQSGVIGDFGGMETASMKPSHYHDAPFNVIEAQGYITENFYWACHSKDADLPKTMSRAWAVGAAVKHLCRLGLKDDVDIELAKAENYLHYARTGAWINE